MATARRNNKAAEAAGPANKGLKIVARRDHFRRAGRAFGAEPETIPLTELTAEEVETLKTEPMLLVVEVDIEAPAAEETGS